MKHGFFARAYFGVVERIVYRLQEEQLAFHVLLHQGFGAFHELLVGDNLGSHLVEVFDGLRVVVAESPGIVEIPVVVVMGTFEVKLARKHAVDGSQGDEGEEVAGGDAKAALRPVVEFAFQNVGALVEVEGGVLDHLHGILLVDALLVGDGLIRLQLNVVNGLFVIIVVVLAPFVVEPILIGSGKSFTGTVNVSTADGSNNITGVIVGSGN